MDQVGIFVGKRICSFDIIEHDGEKLIVLQWLVNQTAGRRKPGLVLPLAITDHTENLTDPRFPRYMCNDILPESIFLGLASHADLKRYGVQTGPDVTLAWEPKGKPH